MRYVVQLALILCIFSAAPCYAKEYFGEFLDRLSGEFIVRDPRPTFKLADQFRFKDPNGLMWMVPPSAEVDGASIPQAFWSFIGGPFAGSYINASVIHDHYCDNKTRTAHDTHRNFYYGMRTSRVEPWMATFMYWVVQLFGPDWVLEEQIVHTYVCDDRKSGITCSQVTDRKHVATLRPSVDLADPNTLALALSKASTVARTLKATNGATLDLSRDGPISATLESIDQNAKIYRDSFVKGEYIQNPLKLGVLSLWNSASSDQIPNWSMNTLPKFSDTLILGHDTIGSVDGGVPFRFDSRTDQQRNLDDLVELLLKGAMIPEGRQLEYKPTLR